MFIRNVKTLMALEEARTANLAKVAVAIQRRWKGFKQMRLFRKLKAAATIQRGVWCCVRAYYLRRTHSHTHKTPTVARGMLARRTVKRPRAAKKVQRLVRRFLAKRRYKHVWDAEQAHYTISYSILYYTLAE
jgi:hypothetical protein